MRKTFEGLSLWEGALLFTSLFFGIFFRILGLSQTSAWGDEVATWYFSQNLLSVIKTESHTPLYYFLCKLWEGVFPSSILSLRYFTISLSLSVLFLCSFFFLKNKKQREAVCLFILWCLWPTLIIYGRQARHYELFLDLTFLLLVLQEFRQQIRRRWFFLFLVFFQLIHPFAIIPVWFLALRDYILKKCSRNDIGRVALTSLPLLLYYVFRFATQGREHVMSNISWISNGTVSFLKQMVTLFAGDSFPLKVFFPVTPLAVAFLSFLIFGVFFTPKRWKRMASLEMKNFVLILFFTFLGVEILSHSVSNFRISRYFIYVVPFFHWALLSFVGSWSDLSYKIRMSFLVSGLVFYSIFLQIPWKAYVWDDQIVANIKAHYPESRNEENFVICGSAFQLKYYFDRAYHHCSEEAFKRYHSGARFVFFDLNGNDKYTAWYLMANGRVSALTSYEHSYSFIFEGRKDGK